MSTDYTTTEMVESLIKRGLIPTSDKTFTTADFIRFMDEELRNFIVPQIMQVRENYFLETYDQTLVANQSRYNINTRAIGMKMKRLFWFNQNDQPEAKIYQTDIERLLELPWQTFGPNPEYFYFSNNYIELIPTPQQGVQGYIRQYFFQRPNRLIQTSECGQITQISGNDVTINSVPTTFNQNEEYDFVKGTPGFQNLAIDKTPTGVSGATFTFASGDVPTDLALGDYLCLAQESPIAQIPLEAFPLLSQQGLYVTLQALNDTAGAEKAKAQRDELLTQTIRLVGIRSEDDEKTIVSSGNIGSYIMGQGLFGGAGWLR